MPDEQRDAEYFKRFIGSTSMQRIKYAIKRMLPGGEKGSLSKGLVHAKRILKP